MEYCSQIGQDKWVVETMRRKTEGFFLDIGAFDGKTISNTYYLEKVLKWSGICVEAGLSFPELQKNRSCIVLNNAIYSQEANLMFHDEGTVSKVKLGGGRLVKAITMRQLIEQYKVPELIDYISLDIEGMEAEALSAFPFDTHEAILWTIEHNAHEDKGRLKKQIKKIMTDRQYICYQENAFEDWWIHPDYVE